MAHVVAEVLAGGVDLEEGWSFLYPQAAEEHRAVVAWRHEMVRRFRDRRPPAS